jgi:hypothetical protein
VLTTEGRTIELFKIWDIADLNNVNLVAEYLAPNNLAHNVHVEGDYAFISHYTSGVVVLDIHDPTDPIEVAIYDTYGLNDNPEFAGCWGVFRILQWYGFSSVIAGLSKCFSIHADASDVGEEIVRQEHSTPPELS